jgi:hypothetical protein
LSLKRLTHEPDDVGDVLEGGKLDLGVSVAPSAYAGHIDCDATSIDQIHWINVQ